MTLNKEKLQSIYDKNLAELQSLVAQHNELDDNIRATQEQLQQLAQQRQQVYTAAMAAKKVVEELQPYVDKKEVPTPETQPETIEVEDEVKAKKAKR